MRIPTKAAGDSGEAGRLYRVKPQAGLKIGYFVLRVIF
jgi:hypothetical protein